MTEHEIIQTIKQDPWMMQVLKTSQELDLPDWWIGAGFVRNMIWDKLHGYSQKTPLNDVDVIYFDPSNINESEEKIFEKHLKDLLPFVPWSVKNEARMANVDNNPPYKSAVDGLSHWVETATCVAVKIDETGELKIAAPYGVEDLTNLILRPSPHAIGKIDYFDQRIKNKGWLQKWPKLKVVKEPVEKRGDQLVAPN